MRILFTTWPAVGHLLPMLPLARAARTAGHDVVVSSGSDLQPLIERHRFRGHRSGTTQAQDYAEVAERGVRLGALPPMEQQLTAARLLFGASGVRRGRDLAPLLDEWRPDVVIHEVTEVGGAAAAEAAGVRHVTHGYGPTLPGTAAFMNAIAEVLLEAGLPDPMPTALAGEYLDICPPALQLAEIPWRRPVPIRPTAGEPEPGETLPDGFGALPDRPLVYLTSGTITNQNPAAFQAVIAACLDRELNVVATTGPGAPPDGVPAAPGVLVTPYLSQSLVLPHCAAVVSHGGAGTLLGALSHGLPQLCLPQGTDQPMNAAALQRAGAGRTLEPEQVTAESVAAELDRLLGDHAAREAAERIAVQIGGMPTADQVLVGLTG